MALEIKPVSELNRIGEIIVDTGFHIHRKLGPGLLESVYHTVFSRDLSRKGLFVENKKPISFEYDGLWFENVCEADIVVERSVVIEVKSRVQLIPVDYMQLLTYLRLMDCRLGFLINFGAPSFKAGVKRIVNGL